MESKISEWRGKNKKQTFCHSLVDWIELVNIECSGLNTCRSMLHIWLNRTFCFQFLRISNAVHSIPPNTTHATIKPFFLFTNEKSNRIWWFNNFVLGIGSAHPHSFHARSVKRKNDARWKTNISPEVMSLQNFFNHQNYVSHYDKLAPNKTDQKYFQSAIFYSWWNWRMENYEFEKSLIAFQWIEKGQQKKTMWPIWRLPEDYTK